MKTKKPLKKPMLILVPAALIFMAVFIQSLRLFTNIEEEPYVSEDADRIVVGLSQLGSESGWRTANTESVQSVFTSENGYFLLFNNARQKQENQIKAIRSFISQRVDYIVFAPVVEDGWGTVLKEAKEAGIPVIMMDRKVEAADQELCVSYPDIDVVVSQNDDMTFGAIEAIREAGRTVGVHGEISIISFDAVHDALKMVADGIINVDIECNPNQGEYLSEVISMLERGETVEKNYYVEEDVFTIENVTEEVLKERNY